LTVVEENSAHLKPAIVLEALRKASILKTNEGSLMNKELLERLREVVSMNLERHMVDNISKYNATHLAACAHSLAEMGLGDRSTFEAVAKGAVKKVQEFDAQGSSSLMWAFATAGEPAADLFKEMRSHLQANPKLLKDFKPQELSDLLWAYATARVPTPGLFGIAAARLQNDPETLKSCSPQSISNLLWAYAAAKVEAPDLFAAAAAHIRHRPKLVEELKPQELSNLLCAYSDARVQVPDLLKVVDLQVS
jgi:hypothetical protein